MFFDPLTEDIKKVVHEKFSFTDFITVVVKDSIYGLKESSQYRSRLIYYYDLLS